MKYAMAMALLLALPGCVSMGTNYDPAAVARLQPGMSENEVVAMLGRPNSLTELGDGRRQFVWVHSTGSIMGAQARSVALMFGSDHRLIQTMSQNSTEIH